MNQPTTHTSWNAPQQERWYVRVFRFFLEPHSSVEDIGERRRAQLLSVLTIILSVLLGWGLLSNPTTYSTFIALFFVSMVSYALSRTRFYRVGAYIFSFGMTSISFLSLYFGTAGGFGSAISTTAHISLIIASLLLSFRGLVWLVVLSTIAAFSTPLYMRTPAPAADEYFRTAGVFFAIGIILSGGYAFRARIERERVKEVNDINEVLENLTDQLEDRVQERTAELDQLNKITSRRAGQLQTITDLAQAISQVRNPDEVFKTAVKLISEHFGFYHVGIFLIDHAGEIAILQAANSAGGQKMLARQHRLAFGTGVVGFSAQTGKPRIALDVGTDAVFFNNRDLPDTRSEIALPMIAGTGAIGVLDVQSTEPGAFSEEDFRVLGTLANQLAIAIENARLISEAKESAAQVQSVYNDFVRMEWSRAEQKAEQAGFRFNAGRIEMLESPLRDDEIASAVRTGSLIARPANGGNQKRAVAAVPVKLRGEVIGVLHIESNDASRIWQDDELNLMEAVAERAALAMENARLFQDARRRAAKERLIAEATSTISGSLNVENILQATAIELERVLGGSEVLIKFNERDSA